MAKQSEFEEFGAAQFLRRKSVSSITMPKEQPVAKSKDIKNPKYPDNIPAYSISKVSLRFLIAMIVLS